MASTTQAEKIGFRWPFQVDGKGGYATVSGDELERSKAQLLMATEAQSASLNGDLPWRQDFGASLDRLRYKRNSPALAELARRKISGAFKRWAPELSVNRVNASTDGNTLSIQITRTRRGSGARNTTRTRSL